MWKYRQSNDERRSKTVNWIYEENGIQSAKNGVAALKGTIEFVTGMNIDDEKTIWSRKIKTAPVINAGIVIIVIILFLIFLIKSMS